MPEMYLGFKHAHMALAFLSLLLFVGKTGWLFTGKSFGAARIPLLVLPHLIYTGLLFFGIALAVFAKMSLMSNGWLLAKLICLVAYIGVGVLATRPSINHTVRLAALFGGIALFFAMVWLAMAKPF